MFEKIIVVPETKLRLWDETNERFKYICHPETKLTLLHSLVSLSLWESKWHTNYFSKTKKTAEQAIDYIRCMTRETDVNPDVYNTIAMSNKLLDEIGDYIDDPMTATIITDNRKNKSNKNEYITSELIYWSMIQHGIPVEFETWHINRLLTLINVCNAKNGGGGKMKKKDILAEYAKINERNRAKYNSKG